MRMGGDIAFVSIAANFDIAFFRSNSSNRVHNCPAFLLKPLSEFTDSLLIHLYVPNRSRQCHSV